MTTAASAPTAPAAQAGGAVGDNGTLTVTPSATRPGEGVISLHAIIGTGTSRDFTVRIGDQTIHATSGWRQGAVDQWGITTWEWSTPYSCKASGTTVSAIDEVSNAPYPAAAAVGSPTVIAANGALPASCTQKASIGLDPLTPGSGVIHLDNSTSTLAAQYQLLMPGRTLDHPAESVDAGQTRDLPFSGIDGTIDVRVYGDGSGSGALLSHAEVSTTGTSYFTDVRC